MSRTDGQSRQFAKASVPRRRLLIVEPDRLTRWSIEEYLRHQYEVASADCAPAAHGLLDKDRYDAIVIADDLPHDGADGVEHHARTCNPGLAAVRTVTHLTAESQQTHSRTVLLEKPFELVSLARVLANKQD